jgi:hypothetical protein
MLMRMYGPPPERIRRRIVRMKAQHFPKNMRRGMGDSVVAIRW